MKRVEFNEAKDVLMKGKKLKCLNMHYFCYKYLNILVNMKMSHTLEKT